MSTIAPVQKPHWSTASRTCSVLGFLLFTVMFVLVRLLPRDPLGTDPYGVVVFAGVILPIAVLLTWRWSISGPRTRAVRVVEILLTTVGCVLGLLSCCGCVVLLGGGGVRDAANRMLNANNLRQLGIAMHNYHNEHFHLPAHAIYSKDGKPLLSWRVAILPYLEHEDLYNEFRLDEPWYSENNLKLLPRMPKVFRRPSHHLGGDTMTHYQMLVGPGAIFENKRPCTLGLISLQDGTANTILIADALQPVPWTKPEDLPFDPNGPVPPLHFQRSRGTTVCFADCSTRGIRKPGGDHDIRLLRQLITRNGGEKEDTSVIMD